MNFLGTLIAISCLDSRFAEEYFDFGGTLPTVCQSVTNFSWNQLIRFLSYLNCFLYTSKLIVRYSYGELRYSCVSKEKAEQDPKIEWFDIQILRKEI